MLIRTTDAGVVARVIGAVLVLTVIGTVVRRQAPSDDRADDREADDREAAGARGGGPVAAVLGAGAGLSTMVANAGGPMMTLYLLRARVTPLAFLGTAAWFFAAVNVLKVPFSVGLGLITGPSLAVSAALVPGVLVGALLGRRLVAGMSRQVFERVALAATAVAGVWLLVR